MKLLIVGGDFVILITSSVVPSQAIGLPIVMMNKPSIMKSAYSNAGLSKKAVIS